MANTESLSQTEGGYPCLVEIVDAILKSVPDPENHHQHGRGQSCMKQCMVGFQISSDDGGDDDDDNDNNNDEGCQEACLGRAVRLSLH